MSDAQGGDTVVVRFEGELDIAAAQAVQQRLLRPPGSGRVLVDLSAVGFIDVAGARALWSARRRAAGEGWRIEVGPCSASVRRLFGLLGEPV